MALRTNDQKRTGVQKQAVRPAASGPAPASAEGAILALQRQTGNRAVTGLLAERRGAGTGEGGAPVVIQRILPDHGADIRRAVDKLATLPAPPPEKKSLFGKVRQGIMKLFGRAPKPSAADRHRQDTSWASNQLQGVLDQLAGLESGLGSESLGELGGRAATGAELLSFLKGVDRICDVLGEGIGTLPSELLDLRTAAEREQRVVQQLMQGAEPAGIGPETSWLHALEVLGHSASITEEIDQAADKVNKGGKVADALGTLNRGNKQSTRSAYEFTGAAVENQVALINGAVDGALAGLEGALDESQGADPDVLGGVEHLIGVLGPLFFPGGLGFVAGPMLEVLRSVAGHTAGLETADALKSGALDKTVADIVFLRRLTPALVNRASVLPEGSKAKRAMLVTSQMLTRVCNGLDAKPSGGMGIYGEVPGAAELLPERDGFFERIIADITQGTSMEKKVDVGI